MIEHAPNRPTVIERSAARGSRKNDRDTEARGSPLPSSRRASCEGHLGFEARQVARDRSDRERPPAAFVANEAILSGDAAVDYDFVPLFGVTDVVDLDVVVLAPEERRRRETLTTAHEIERRDLSLAFGDDSVSTRIGSSLSRSSPGG